MDSRLLLSPVVQGHGMPLVAQVPSVHSVVLNYRHDYVRRSLADLHSISLSERLSILFEMLLPCMYSLYF